MMFEVGTDEELRAVITELFSRARQGDVAAIRLVLAYTAGRPGPAPDPDSLDREELELATSTAAAVVPALAASERFSPDVAVGLLRTRLDVQARLGARAFLQRAARSDEGRPEGQKQWDHPAVRKAAAMPPVWPDEAPEHGADEEPLPNPAPAPAPDGADLVAPRPRRVEVTPLGVGDPEELQRRYDDIRRAAEAERAEAQRRAANKQKRKKGKRKKRR